MTSSGPEGPSGAVVELDTAGFAAVIPGHPFAIVDFWAPWCAPCRAFAPVFETVAARHPDILFAKVDTEAEQTVAAHFGIRSIPTLMIFRDNIIVFAEAGALPPPRSSRSSPPRARSTWTRCAAGSTPRAPAATQPRETGRDHRRCVRPARCHRERRAAPSPGFPAHRRRRAAEAPGRIRRRAVAGVERLVYFVLFPALLFRSLASSPLALGDAGRSRRRRTRVHASRAWCSRRSRGRCSACRSRRSPRASSAGSASTPTSRSPWRAGSPASPGWPR